MTNKEILEKAIKKAVENGYPNHNYNFNYAYSTAGTIQCDGIYISVCFLIFSHDFAKSFYGEEKYESSQWVVLYEDNFNTFLNKWTLDEFKRIYPKKHKQIKKGIIVEGGNRYYRLEHERSRVKEGWQYHLQNQVLSEDPIQYLKSFI